jgi:hypothetical protein
MMKGALMNLGRGVLAAGLVCAGCGTTDLGRGELSSDVDSEGREGEANCAGAECGDVFAVDSDSDVRGDEDGTSPDGVADAGPAIPPCMELSAAPTTIGPLEPGQSAEANILVENCSSNLPLTVRSWGLTLDSAPSFAFDSPLNLSLVIEAGQNVGVSVFYSPTLVGADESARFGVLLDEGDGPEYVELQGLSSDRSVECLPVEIECTIEGDTSTWPVGYVASFDGVVTCTPSLEEGRRGMSFSWSLDSPGDPPTELSILGQRTAQFGFGKPGLYELSLQVVVDGEPVQCGSPSIRYVAKYVGDVVVELQWTLLPGAPTPAPGFSPENPDLFLHLLQSERGCWRDDFYDCHLANTSPDWGQLADEGDDPSLFLNNAGIGAPEVITMSRLEATTYAIGVHYSRDRAWGDAIATASIYIDDVLAFTAERRLTTAEFWHVADLDGARLTVNSVDQPYRTIATPQCD